MCIIRRWNISIPIDIRHIAKHIFYVCLLFVLLHLFLLIVSVTSTRGLSLKLGLASAFVSEVKVSGLVS